MYQSLVVQISVRLTKLFRSDISLLAVELSTMSQIESVFGISSELLQLHFKIMMLND